MCVCVIPVVRQVSFEGVFTNLVRVIQLRTLEIYIVAVFTRQNHIHFEQSACVFCREIGESASSVSGLSS